MLNLFRNIRFYVLLGSVLLSISIFVWAKMIITNQQLQIIRIEQVYAIISLIYLYITLLAGPFCYTFHTFPFKKSYLKARRALGVATFYFAFLHSFLAFFGQLNGFQGFAFLGNSFLIPIVLGFFALIILFFLTVTSFD